MNGQGAHLARFIALSAALHAAGLLIGGRPETSIGPAGRTLHVSMTYRTAAAAPASAAGEHAARSPARRAPPHAATNRPAPVMASSKTAGRGHDNPPHETAAVTPVTTQQARDVPDPGESAPSADGTEISRQSTEEHLRESILRLVSSRFSYPVLARRKGIQGIVTLQVRIESDGRISGLHVKQTSGYPVLDRAALQSLQLASVPDARQWMNGQAIDIIIPVEYRLVGG